MNTSLAFARVFYLILSIIFLTAYTVATSVAQELNFITGLKGIVTGLAFGFFLIGMDNLFKKASLKSFNLALVGLFLGSLFGQALLSVTTSLIETLSFTPESSSVQLVKAMVLLFGTYMGMMITIRSSEEFALSIPFVKFRPTVEKRKDILFDSSILLDTRVIDLAASGLINHQVLVPRFIVKEYQAAAESGDESEKARARKGLETVKKLEALPALGLRYDDMDFGETPDITVKTIQLARARDAQILTADINRIQASSVEGIQVINIHDLSKALKPLMQTSELIEIKVQRYGKEPRQGVGYLEDGTMVVVNGGGDFIGQTIKAHVLSVKHTSSGRMIFCNAMEEGATVPPMRDPAHASSPYAHSGKE